MKHPAGMRTISKPSNSRIMGVHSSLAETPEQAISGNPATRQSVVFIAVSLGTGVGDRVGVLVVLGLISRVNVSFMGGGRGVWLDNWHPEMISSPKASVRSWLQVALVLRAEINHLIIIQNRSFMKLLRIFLCASNQSAIITFHQMELVELHMCIFKYSKSKIGKHPQI